MVAPFLALALVTSMVRAFPTQAKPSYIMTQHSKFALENFCLKEKADDHFQGENVEFGVSIEDANEKEYRRDDSEYPIIPLFVATILNNKAILHLTVGHGGMTYTWTRQQRRGV